MSDEFIICETCLGSNKNIKMMKQPNGEECKLCTRPFTIYRWHSDASSSTKTRKTIICTTCARVKNCCQSCMLDINYGISIDIRDTALKMAGLDNLILRGSETTKNREVKAIMADKYDEKFKTADSKNENESKQQVARELLLKLSTRLKDQKQRKITDKYNGNTKSIEVLKFSRTLPFNTLITIPSSQPELTSFFVFGIDSNLPQYSITNYAKEHGGPVLAITIVHRAKCGFITFIDRKSAEKFANHIIDNKLNPNDNPGLIVLDKKFPVRFTWGKPVNLGISTDDQLALSQVVNRVMKQLADKDRPKDSHLSGKTKFKLNKVVKPKSNTMAKNRHDQKSTQSDNDSTSTSYHALSKDFEI